MKIAKVMKGSWFGPWVVAALCALLLTYASPRKAEATAVEYAVMLALIIVVCITADVPPSKSTSESWSVVGNQLITAANGAADANSAGDQSREISRLSKAIGAADALMGMTSSCDDCNQASSDLQEIIGLAGLLKARALGVAACPEGSEQCDPLAVPTGCPIAIVPTFCNDECMCVPVIP